MALVITGTTLGRRVVGRAGLTAIEVRERLVDVVLDHRQLHDLLADLLLLLVKQGAHAGGRFGGRAGTLEIADKALDLGESEPDRLQLDDPVDAIDRLGPVQTEATLGPRAG